MAYRCSSCFFQDQFQDGRLVAILLLKVSPPFLRSGWSEFIQTWHKHSTLWHTFGPHFILQFAQRWPTGTLAAILVVHKYGLDL